MKIAAFPALRMSVPRLTTRFLISNFALAYFTLSYPAMAFFSGYEESEGLWARVNLLQKCTKLRLVGTAWGATVSEWSLFKAWKAPLSPSYQHPFEFNKAFSFFPTFFSFGWNIIFNWSQYGGLKLYRLYVQKIWKVFFAVFIQPHLAKRLWCLTWGGFIRSWKTQVTGCKTTQLRLISSASRPRIFVQLMAKLFQCTLSMTPMLPRIEQSFRWLAKSGALHSRHSGHSFFPFESVRWLQIGSSAFITTHDLV